MINAKRKNQEINFFAYTLLATILARTISHTIYYCISCLADLIIE
jgi:hypothetical protein